MSALSPARPPCPTVSPTSPAKSGRLFLTVIALPAPDEFTSPAILELRSTEPLGEPGESFRGKVRLGGYPNSFAGKDGFTVNSARNSLDVVA